MMLTYEQIEDAVSDYLLAVEFGHENCSRLRWYDFSQIMRRTFADIVKHRDFADLSLVLSFPRINNFACPSVAFCRVGVLDLITIQKMIPLMQLECSLELDWSLCVRQRGFRKWGFSTPTLDLPTIDQLLDAIDEADADLQLCC